MGPLADTFHLTVDVPLYLVNRPRLWRVVFGAACLPVGLALLWVEQVAASWHSTHLGEAHIAGLALLLLGVFYIAKAVLNDLLHVHRLSFSKQGMHLVWSQVPQLYGARRQQERFFFWADLNALLWMEGSHEHTLAQHLQVEFKEQIGLRRNQIKVLVCDERNPVHCEKLIAFLPEDFVIPEWLDVARKKQVGGSNAQQAAPAAG